MKAFCENQYCENPGFKQVEVSANKYGDSKRTFCASCEEAYTIGCQHGSMRPIHVCQPKTHMLILSRKLLESVMIGDTITVKILSINKHTVRLGITAPAEVSVFREELVESVKASGGVRIKRKKEGE